MGFEAEEVTDPSQDQHTIPEAIEAIAQPYGFLIGMVNKPLAGEGTDQHQ